MSTWRPKPAELPAVRRAAWAGVVAAGLAVLAWTAIPSDPGPTTPPAAANQTTRIPDGLPAARAPAASPVAPPFSAEGAQAREAQRALWRSRLERAERALDTYRAATRYPPGSQPAAAHPDQLEPNQPVVEERPLAGADGKPGDGATLHTTQERIHVQGAESVRFTLALHDREGRTLPLRVVRAGARELPPPGTASLFPELAMNFNDEGQDGDARPGDGVFSARLQPANQGFSTLFGPIRVEAILQYRGPDGERGGRAYFDLFYTPEPPATWVGGVRETVEDGSLAFHLKAEVRKAGRYVVSARVDDAGARPFALLAFNQELQAGTQEIRLVVFGKLLRDARPAFPLTLRDVEGFLLLPDAFPDRALLPRRSGVVHVGAEHVLASFAEAEWTSEQRSRYLDELGRDVAQARAEVERLGQRP